ncbi:helix-turn-helix domain-containing protein [Mesorhizobium sp. 131-3-5]|uniref:helix-turn-helix domain-containing protein n=1 Tax=Mesorhizobium sp. 131-3-5 TaxID=2744520 RepID=UPI00192538DB|nr:helix-turn-helix domain-containing protein [Mesorhizobium sp. 131-3-5]
MTKYDWIIAVSHNWKHGRRPRDLRVAIALMNLADAATCMAWPTQESLAEMTGLADERQVRAALASLVGTGAIEKKKVSDLSEESAGKLDVKRKGRGVAYKLKLFWACEILELSMATQRAEPARLASSDKKGKRTDLDRFEGQPNRTDLDRQNRTDLDRSQADQLSPPNTTEETKDTIRSPERTASLASTREASAYALATGRAG